MSEEKKKHSITGVIISDKTEKTRIVVSEGIKKHPIYGKYVKTRKKLMVHDETNLTKVGDKVEIVETKPISKRKKWTIVTVVAKAE